MRNYFKKRTKMTKITKDYKDDKNVKNDKYDKDNKVVNNNIKKDMFLSHVINN